MNYNCALTVDCVLFSGDSVVLIKRKNLPFQGCFALPGGFVEENETVETACMREAKEETNLDLMNLKLIGVYSEPGRDPRGRMVTTAFMAEVADFSIMKAGDDAKEIEIVQNWQDVDLAFDHKKIIQDALKFKK